MKIRTYLILSIFLALSCSNEHGIEPLRSSIQGVITYSGDWPAPAAEVRIVAATKFPPSGVSDLIIGESIPLTGSSYDYTFYLKPNSYKIVGVAWREDNSIWDIMSICGLYFSGSDSLAPGEVTISTDTSQVKHIDIFVSRSKAKRITESKIIGAIVFEGSWPDSISEARVIATTKFSPPDVMPTLLDLSFSDNIIPNTDSVSYKINAFPGTYAATGIIFFRKNHSLSLDDIIYSMNIGGVIIRQYDVPEDSTVAGPNFHIKF